MYRLSSCAACVCFVCRLVAYAHKASVARVLRTRPDHAMFGDSLTLSPSTNAEAPPGCQNMCSSAPQVQPPNTVPMAGAVLFMLHCCPLLYHPPITTWYPYLSCCIWMNSIDAVLLGTVANFGHLRALQDFYLHTDMCMVCLQASRAAPNPGIT